MWSFRVSNTEWLATTCHNFSLSQGLLSRIVATSGGSAWFGGDSVDRVPRSLVRSQEFGWVCFWLSSSRKWLSLFVDLFGDAIKIFFFSSAGVLPSPWWEREIEAHHYHLYNIQYSCWPELSTKCLGTGTKWCCVQTLGTQDVITHLNAWVRGLDLVLGHGRRSRILGWVLEKTVCSH